MPQALPPTHWPPRGPSEVLEGWVWLGRLIDKAKRKASGAPMEGYWSLEDSLADVGFLKRWGVLPGQIRAWVQEGLDDQAIAKRFWEAAGAPSLEERARDNRFRSFISTPFRWMIDAQEGRVPAGPGRSLLLGGAKALELALKALGKG